MHAGYDPSDPYDPGGPFDPQAPGLAPGPGWALPPDQATPWPLLAAPDSAVAAQAAPSKPEKATKREKAAPPEQAPKREAAKPEQAPESSPSSQGPEPSAQMLEPVAAAPAAVMDSLTIDFAEESQTAPLPDLAPSAAADAEALIAQKATKFEKGGLDVCAVARDPDGLANEAIDTRTYTVALDCDGGARVRLIVDRFDDVAARDGAAQQFEVRTRPRSDGVVWTWGPYTLFANGARDDDVMERLTEALDDAGAK